MALESCLPWRCCSLALVVLGAACLAVRGVIFMPVPAEATPAGPLLTHAEVFPNEGPSYYRIPSLVVANDGTVPAFCNRRVGSPHDRVPHVELVLRRSKDGGKYEGKGYNCANYSDDHGKTWKTSEPVQPDTGEACLVELPDGTTYLNSRSCSGDGKRKIALSRDGGETFRDFSISDVLRECNFGTNAALLGVPASVHGMHMVLFSNPPYNAPGMKVLRDRRQMTVRLSLDAAKTWPVSKLVFEGPSGYSSLAMTKEGEFLLLYEKGEKIYRDRGISIARFDLEWLTDGKDLASLSRQPGQ